MKYHENRTPENKDYYKRYKQFKVMTENLDFVNWIERNGEDIVLQNKVVLRELNFDYDEKMSFTIGRILNKMIDQIFTELEDLTFNGTMSETDITFLPQQKWRMRIFVQLYMFWLGPLNRPHPELFAPSPYPR
tara:strand:- start:115 stop:513 length:399 start_codon:yes stop_codon:yes gene_type:complete